jgi:ubiquitin-like modifier-activating enzyme ATG7
MTGLKFAPWSSDIELSFYATLRSIKINHDKLSAAARRVIGRYEIKTSDVPERSCRMQLHGDAFKNDDVPLGFYRAEGILRNVNTIEEYKALDQKEIMNRAARTIWDAILDGTIYSCPSLLASFHAIFFADLKRYRYTYHFAFPSLQSDPAWDVTNDPLDSSSKLSKLESRHLVDAVQTWRYSVDKRQHGFFLARRDRSYSLTMAAGAEAKTGDDEPTSDKEPRRAPDTPKGDDLEFAWVVGSLASFETGFFASTDPVDRFVCFADPSTHAQYPNLVLRNLLALVRQRWHLDDVQVLCYRDTHSRRDQAHSLILTLESSTPMGNAISTAMPKVTGWERNERGAINSRVVDLGGNMDPRQFADQSVDLNIKLMKWRIAPELDLDVIKDTKCLLLGAGTLGSYVSRNLLGWGVRKITFVDNGKVSYSNPVRQPLFDFKDCLNGGVNKADRAAEALKEIYPGVQSEGYVMSVPMIGHPVMDEAKTLSEYNTLKRLIDEHDAIFLLMDTRESRWLPTLIGKASGKIVMNAALGFDTYVVMRHGVSTQDGAPSLGCYFCNDVVAPADVSHFPPLSTRPPS